MAAALILSKLKGQNLFRKIESGRTRTRELELELEMPELELELDLNSIEFTALPRKDGTLSLGPRTTRIRTQDPLVLGPMALPLHHGGSVRANYSDH